MAKFRYRVGLVIALIIIAISNIEAVRFVALRLEYEKVQGTVIRREVVDRRGHHGNMAPTCEIDVKYEYNGKVKKARNMYGLYDEDFVGNKVDFYVTSDGYRYRPWVWTANHVEFSFMMIVAIIIELISDLCGGLIRD